MKNVRVFFSKKGRMKFVSHLDMNRFFTRILRKSRLPIWYTEGFNPHPYLTFALPLSLGFESECEVLDFRLVDDDFQLEMVGEELTAVLPEDIKILNVAEPVMKPGKITAAGFDITFNDENVADLFSDYLASGSVVVTKKTKRGDIKTEEVSDKILDLKINGSTVSLIIPAGNDNLNPTLLVSAFEEKIGYKTGAAYLRKALYVENGKTFL